ncbi:MAG TPA: substrate-binding domain-containing protein [Bryobacteraceae bacterium]|nr:substrate-binding domain-containing protein [Bryobacteraceae bacterium]
MTRRFIAAVLAVAATVWCGFLTIQATAAENAPVHVLVSNGMKAAMEELQPLAERTIGHPLAPEFSSTAALKKKIQGGEAFDATVITTGAIDSLIKEGKLTAASRTELGRSILGIGIRAGAARPDIRTVDALKKTLRAAHSITYPRDGASRGDLEKMFERLGIAAEIKPKIVLANGSGAAAESVASGQVEMVLTLFSEIVPVHGLEILGPLPGEYQSDVRFSAAASSATKSPEAAKALIAFLAGPQAASVLKAKGLEPKK